MKCPHCGAQITKEYTLEECINAGILVGIPEEKSKEFFYHYDSQGWVFGNGIPLMKLSSAMQRWKLKNYLYEDDKKSKIQKAMEYE